MPYRATFDCLWCGTPHTCRGPDDLEGWAQLCPECVGKAGDNGFLRYRLRGALSERGAAGRGPDPAVAAVAATSSPVGTSSAAASEAVAPALSVPSTPTPAAIGQPTVALADAMVDYYEARAPEYDDWYMRRGRYEHGPVHDAAWNAELDAAGRFLDAQPFHGEIVELAAGTGWWSPLLASKGVLSLYDAAEAPLARARDRLVAHGLRAHLHQRDAWAEPDRTVDAVFTGFWLSHVERHRLVDFLRLVRRWLVPDGRFAFIDSLADHASGAVDHRTPDRRHVGPSARGRPRVHDRQGLLHAGRACRGARRAGFADVSVTTTGRFFVLGSARAV